MSNIQVEALQALVEKRDARIKELETALAALGPEVLSIQEEATKTRERLAKILQVSMKKSEATRNLFWLAVKQDFDRAWDIVEEADIPIYENHIYSLNNKQITRPGKVKGEEVLGYATPPDVKKCQHYRTDGPTPCYYPNCNCEMSSVSQEGREQIDAIWSLADQKALVGFDLREKPGFAVKGDNAWWMLENLNRNGMRVRGQHLKLWAGTEPVKSFWTVADVLEYIKEKEHG